MTRPAGGLTAGTPLAALLNAPMRPGSVVWIGLRPERHAPLLAVDQAVLSPAAGLEGDHYHGGSGRGGSGNRGSGNRQVTLIQAEHLVAIAAYLGLPAVGPDRPRRNIVVRGVNLLALKDQRIRVGSAELLVTGLCHPCSRMEAAFGPGGYNAVRGHGGVTARVVVAGVVSVGDAVGRVDTAQG